MAEFKKSNLHTQLQTKTAGNVQISQTQGNTTATVTEYHAPEMHVAGGGGYQKIKEKYGPLAATDPERQERRLRDRRFSLNSLLRDPLSVDQEETRVLEERVQTRVDLLAKEAQADGFNLGHAEGLETGAAQAVNNLREDGAEHLARLEALLVALEQAKSEIFQANEKFLIELVFRMGRMILLKELATDRQYVTRLTTSLIERLGVKEHIRIKIALKDAETIEVLRGSLETVFGKMENLHIEASDDVLGGGCKVETDWSGIDASVETQLKSIHEALGVTAAEGAMS